MKYKLKKYVISVLIVLLFFSIIWYMQNDTFISSSNDNILLIMNGSLQGYSSLRVLTILSLVFLLFMNILAIKEETSYLTRKSDRVKLFHGHIANIFFSSLLFVGSFLIVNVVFTFIFIGNDIMLDHNFYIITFLNGVAMVFLYWWIGILDKILEDWFHSKNIAIVITFILVALSYFIETPFWVPIEDIRIYEMLLSDVWDFTILSFIYIRQLGLAIILYIVGKIIFNEKDFIFYER
ncbi:WxPxxD family membrane protein [Niallia sp. 01092]|uniref:WxPxxD family membrane protein n=1 Tax=unclassified Niallia TaxID=2837522 RepID=UPI003FD65BC0